MTQKKQLKARVRARMARTGESYTTALRHVTSTTGSSVPSAASANVTATRPAAALVVDHGYALRGGQHPESANIAHVLAHYGVTAGKGGEPVSEVLVFGAGGGPGAGYILWEFKQHGSAILTLGFRNQWQYTDRWLQKTLDRLGVRYLVEHTGGAAGAARRLTELLAAGRPCIVRPDRYVLGYWGLPYGCGSPDVVVYAQDGDRVHIDDRNVSPLTVPRATLDAARARVGSYTNSLYAIDPATGPISTETLHAAVEAGLEDCVDHLSAASDSFSLPAWRKWTRLLTDQKNAKAWPRVFAGRRALAGALLSVWEGVMPAGGDGGHVRDLYANFLEAAAALLDNPALREPAEAFRAAARAWQTVADTALPDDVPALAQLRDLTVAVRQSIVDPASVSPEEATQSIADLWALRTQLDRDFPLDDAAVTDLFAALSSAIGDVYQRETAAVAQLAEAIGRRWIGQ